MAALTEGVPCFGKGRSVIYGGNTFNDLVHVGAQAFQRLPVGHAMTIAPHPLLLKASYLVLRVKKCPVLPTAHMYLFIFTNTLCLPYLPYLSLTGRIYFKRVNSPLCVVGAWAGPGKGRCPTLTTLPVLCLVLH